MRELTELEKWAVDMDDGVLVRGLERLRHAALGNSRDYTVNLQCECAGYLKALLSYDVIEAPAFAEYLAEIRTIARGMRHA